MPWKLNFLFGMLILTMMEAKLTGRKMPVPTHPGFTVRGADLTSFRTTNQDSEESAWEKTDLFEGDIVVSRFRNALDKPSRRWKMPVPVCVDDDFDEDEQEMINDALYEIKSKTCVSFRACNEHDSDFIMVMGNSTGCWSSVGRLEGGQILHLQKDGCMNHGTIVHEFLHALGFYHQHSDPERDDFVNIHWENIKPHREGNFKTYKKEYTYAFNAFNITYDYGSLMHYGRKSFTKNGKDTIKPKDEKAKIGQRIKMSPKDIRKVNLLYECGDDNSVKKEEDELDDFFDF